MFSTPPRALVTQCDQQMRVGRSAQLFGCLACILLVDGLFSALVLPHAPGRMAEPSAALISALLFFLIAIFALPNLNRDIYNYIISGRVSAVYSGNPYELAPNRFPDDLLYPYASARYASYVGNNKLPWMLMKVGLGRLGDNPVANLLLYRVMFLFFNLANLLLIAHIRHAVQPQWKLVGLVLYA